ncbi:MAG: monovalent cation/H(+) antiporter subunit G [Coriobacteriales bacterium]|nr:monovalent cation/H(+) antiporter subunit G [Actinomycetes bacterium]
MTDTAVVTRAISAVLACTGAFFFLVGTIGILRLPDFYSRTHAATKCDTVGAGAVLLSLAVLHGLSVDTLKIVAIATFVLLSSPTVGNALARAAYRTGLRPWTRQERSGGEK